MIVRRVVAFASVLFGIACLTPTQFTITILTDVPCEIVGKTEIFVGDEAKLRADGVPTSAETSACTPRVGSNTIGSIVTVPSHIGGDRFTVHALLSKKTPTGAIVDCSKGLKLGCVEAWRTAGFVNHSSLSMSILLEKACENRMCPLGTTCIDGKCVDNKVDPKGMLDASTDGAMMESDAGVVEASTDGPTSSCMSPATGVKTIGGTLPTSVWRLEGPNKVEDDSMKFSAPLVTGAQFVSGAPGCGNGLETTSMPQSLGDGPGNSTFGEALWVNANKDGQLIARVNLQQQSKGWGLSIVSGVLQLTRCNVQCSSLIGKTSLLGQWHRIAVVATLNANMPNLIDVELFVDGMSDGMMTFASFPATTPLTVGPLSNGTIDQVEQYVIQ